MYTCVLIIDDHLNITVSPAAVLLVGYGTHKELFSTKPYWLIKNRCGIILSSGRTHMMQGHAD